MIARTAALFVAATLAVSAMAAPSNNNNYCTNGSVQCCNQVQNKADIDQTLRRALNNAGVVLEEVTGEIGLGCTAVDVFGGGAGQTCSQTQVCCTGNNFSGLAVVGCTPLGVTA